jgi:diguanylate cyclase (GGDEF)-like protein/hemerythrin-like metal-binding protein
MDCMMTRLVAIRTAGRTPSAMDHRAGTVLRRGGTVLVAVGLFSSICVFFGHHWFHYELLPALGVSDALGDSIGGFVIILMAYIGQRIVSLLLFHDTELGSTLEARQLEQANQGLQLAFDELDLLAGTDKLTGAWNRRWLDEAVPSEMDRMARYDHPLSLLIMDVDFFKTINDRHGHDAGDQVLVELALQIRSALRTSDSLARWGGEEFVVLCPNTTLTTASVLAGRLREKIAKADFPEAGHLTVSIGVAEFLPGETWEQCFQRADAKLFQAKAGGRNQIQISPETPQRGNAGEKAAARFLQLVWHKAYESGHEEIDREHQALFDRANDLLVALLSGRPSDEAVKIVDAFICDIAQHFQHEEAVITATGYPGAASHTEIHRELHAKAVRLTDRFRNGFLEAGELFQFLAQDIVAKHILGADREFFHYLKARR